MEFTIVYIIVYVVEALILFLYCHKLFLPKRQKPVFATVYISGYLFLFALSELNIFWVNTLIFCLINALIIFYLYQVRFGQALFHALAITIFMGMSELIILSALTHLSHNFIQSVSIQTLCILAAASKILYFLLMYHFSNIFAPKKQSYHALYFETVIMTLVPLFSLWVMITLAFIYSSANLSVRMNRMISVSSFLILLFNILIWEIYQIMHRKNEEYIEMHLLMQKEYDQKQYYQAILKQDENQRILIHDMKQHLQSLAMLNEKQEQEKISAYLQQLITSDTLQSPLRVCDHELMNQIICRYQHVCREKSISLITDIRKNCLSFLTDAEITSLFCNLLDNAVAAASYKDSTYIDLGIRRHEENDSCIITMINSCKTTPFSASDGRLRTTKKDKHLHGYGLKSIQKIVDSHHGNMELYYDAKTKEFHTIIMLQ